MGDEHHPAQPQPVTGKPQLTPAEQFEKYGFNIDESLATSYVGKYTLYHTIGQGAFGKVKVAVCKHTGEVFAVKIMDKRQILKQDFTSQVRREIYIMRSLKHKHIVRMHEVLSSESKLYIVMDYITGGELFHHLEKNGRVRESVARQYFQQLVDGVDFCHRSGVAHRDLKPENLLLDENGDIKITDFGFSSMRGIDVNADLLHTQCGTPDYCAPEIIESSPKGYSGAKVDAWSCGIILYALLSGRLPFVEQDTEKLYDLITACKVEYPKWISPGARDLLENLLVRNPSKRYALQEVKAHPWFLVDYEGDDARLLKKRPFFNKNNQKTLTSAPTTPAVQETPTATETPTVPETPSIPETRTGNGLDATRSTQQATDQFTPHEEGNSIGEELNTGRGATGGRIPPTGRVRETNPEVDAHMRAPTPPIHAVLTRVEDRPATPAMAKSQAQKPERTADGILANGSVLPAVTPTGTNRAPSPMPYCARRSPHGTRAPTTPAPVKPSSVALAPVTTAPTTPGPVLPVQGHSEPGSEKKSEEPREISNGSYEVDTSSEGGDSIEDYQDKPVPELELPSEPLSLNRVRPPQNQRQRTPVSYSHQVSRSQHALRGPNYDQVPAQRHRSDVSESSLSRPFNFPQSAIESVSLSALPRRKLTAAPSNATRDPRGLRTIRNPTSPLVSSAANGSHPAPLERFDPASPSYMASRQHSTPEYSTSGYNGRIHPDAAVPRHTPWREASSKGRAPYMLQTETCARHIWSIVTKWRGFQEPVSPTSSHDILSDFRVLQSEVKSFRLEDKAVVLDRFLGLFEAYGLSELQNRQSVASGIHRNRHRLHSDLDDDDDTTTTTDGREDCGHTAGESRHHSQRRLPTDVSSEEETLSWSPVLADSQRQQSDLARRREMSDLLNKWILKTNSSNPTVRGPVPPAAPSADEEVPSSSMDISELQRLMRQHQTGREESNLADELYKLMHPETLEDTGNGVFSAPLSQPGQSPPAPNVQSTRSADNHLLNRWQIPLHQKRATMRQASGTSNGRLHFDYSHARYGDSQGTLPSVLDGYGDKSSASVGNSSDNNSYPVITSGSAGGHSSVAPRNRSNMATSMGMNDVEYYGPERKGGMAMKIRGALLTMKVRNQKLAEGLTQFKSSLPPEDIIRLLVAVLQSFGAIVTLKKETKRKLKCRMLIHDDHYLCAAIEFSSADNGTATNVIFKRSKEDRGRTDVSSFHDFYDTVRQRFFAEVQTRYDRNRSGLPKRKRSPRYVASSFG